MAALPHLGAFWPGRHLVAAPTALAEAAPAGLPCAAPWRWTPGPFRPPSLGGRQVPVLLLIAQAEDPVAAALADPTPRPDAAAVRQVMARFAEARLGAPPGLADPGGTALGFAPRGARVVIDPCDPAGEPAARRALDAARQAGGPVLVARDPFATTGVPVLPGSLGPFDPWTLLDAAASLHGASRDLAVLALAAGIPMRDGALADADPMVNWAAILAATRAADPWRGTACTIAEGIETLALWRQREAESRGIAACLGVHPYKRDRVRALLASAAPPPVFQARPDRAIAAARQRGGALLAWSASAPADLPARCADAGVGLRWLEDGFIRSAGLGAAFRPGASFMLDEGGPYFDPNAPSDLVLAIERGDFSPVLQRRAAALRQAIVERGVTKYNLSGVMPRIAARPGQRVVLVPGQVEDDASVRLGGGAIRRNIDLLRAVRAAEPDAHLLYKPHPDIEAGFRQGRIPAADLAALADQVLEGVPMAPLLARVDAVHVLTSLTGFEALLRGLPVTCWGTPFYAGWGLTEDRAPLPPGAPPRTRRASLDEVVAAALILAPRCIDPLTLLPCPPELLLERMARPDLFPPGRLSWVRAAEGWLRRTLSRIGGLR